MKRIRRTTPNAQVRAPQPSEMSFAIVMHRTRGLVLGTLAALAILLPHHSAAAQQPPTPPPFHLATLFDLGHLLLDENGDGVPDRLGAALILAPDPTDAERAAAAEITARLGFETMALDLPIRRGPQPGQVGILIGHRAVEAAGLSVADFGVGAALPPTVAAHTTPSGDRWLAVLGGDDTALLGAARLLAGALPHVRTLSSPSLTDVTDELSTWLNAGDTTATAATLHFTRATLEASGDGVHLHADLGFESGPDPDRAADALDRLQFLAWERLGNDAIGPDSVDLRLPGLASVTVGAGGRQVILPTLAEPGPSGGGSARPGGGGSSSLDLSNVYTTDGFLTGSDIPSGIGVVVVPGHSAEGVADLTARLGLEATGLTVPLVRRLDEIESAASEPTTVLVGSDHPLIDELADSGRISTADLGPGQGLIEFVPDAFGSKSAVVVTGADHDGATLATKRLAEVFPNVSVRGDDTPTFDDIEYELWGTLSGYTPVGQAAIGLYKLDRIVAGLADEDVTAADIMISLEKPADGLADYVRGRAAALGAAEISVMIDDRDVQRADTIFDDSFTVPSEVDRFWTVFENQVLPGVRATRAIRLHARLSEPPEIRRAIAAEARDRLIAAGADPDATTVEVLSAFKQGFFWLTERIAPQLAGKEIGEIVIEFLRNDPPPEWPQQAIHTPLRWLHEIFPVDEVLAEDLGLAVDRIRFEMVDSGPIYRVRATAPDGATIVEDTFAPVWVLRPYFDRFQDYEHVRVTTGWVTAIAEGDMSGDTSADTLAHGRIVTDPEWFWDRYQDSTLPAVYDYVMDRHDGNPRGGSADAPFFGTLEVELELSEPEYRLGVDNEIISTMDALHEEVYFGTIEFFHLLGRNARGQDLTYPGRIIPVMRPKGDGGAGRGRISLTGFATDRPAVVVRYETRDGREGEERLDIPKITMERPSLRRVVIAPGAAEAPGMSDAPALPRLDLRVRVDSEGDEREALLIQARAEQVDARMISAEQVAATLANIGALRDAGMYADALAWNDVGEIGVWAEWTHEQNDSARVATTLPGNGTPAPLPVWTDLLPEGWSYDGERIVQWDTPIPPPEGDEMTAKLSHAFDEATMYRVGESYLGRTTWAMDLMPPITATHWSRAKATTFKPTVIYSARQHANEVSSTSHVLRHAELLLTDSEQRARLDKVNVVIHPFTNPDGAQLAYDLYRITPDYILHAGYLASLGVDVSSGGGQNFPIYPESKVRGQLWERWLPDIFLNPHGYPSHQVVQLFSEYQGLVRRGRVTERNWGFNKGWFMPGFGYIDDPEFPRHKDAAFKIRDYITAGINSNRDVFEMNQRTYARYRRYGADFDPDVFRLPMTDSVLIEMPLKGSRGGGGGGGFNPRITIWNGITEAPDETAYGPWMELVAKAGLSWDQAILDYLYDGDHEVERSGSAFSGGVTLRMSRERPPREEEEGDAGGS
ncbi:MAG: M14 family metallopeptidase [Gemmatimonadetes bacterium]|nr:M14 family metallopeptidase [Gemmatimonadota bacterium]